ncbi:transcription factor Adf-1-like [Wyeomyia smithii]|uniref:transcription factor Adf-1-like n=1 Tax=Wyeomyia smithii TaxID=174621 RepID=UPI00246807AD|nr:transcription factor Adf-1-like [Wyeomyia smithii]
MNQQLLLQQQQQQQRRRQSLLTKSVQEEHLIQQVKLRPVLYDKSLKAYRKPGATDCAWAEIASALGVQVDNCKKRWKSLRDTFIKYFRQEILATPGSKRKKWVYYEHMNFLRNHVELYGISETDSTSDKETVTSDDAQIIHIAEFVTEQVNIENSVGEQFDDNQTEYVYEEVEEGSPVAYALDAKQVFVETASPDPSVEATVTGMTTVTHNDLDISQDDDNSDNVPFLDHISEEVKLTNTNTTSTISDPDERFLLSCAPVLKRLSARKNALVKLRIQQLLYEVEFGDLDKVSDRGRGNN